ncbi:MAG: adenylosuccinate lyase [Myxococcota bacterium]|jgi:adenylosuccinate lyase
MSTGTSPEQYGHDRFLSPFTWRYGTDAMRQIWGEEHKRSIWRDIWVALAATQAEAGLVTDEQVEDLRANKDRVDIDEAHRLEAELQHDLMAEVHVYAAQCEVGGGVIHLGATSMDVEDNADVIRLRESMDLLIARASEVANVLADRIDETATWATMAFTHLQPAEPTTMGYRLAQYGQDLATDLVDFGNLRAELKGKGFKGAVGTSASYAQLLEGTPLSLEDFESRLMARIDLPAFPVATQTAPRKQEYRLLCGLASLGQTLYKFAADLRLLQSPPLGEWAEPFGSKQIGSSAMPFKRNPINAENMDSQARLLATLPRVAWDNAAHSYLERTLDDSANRRTVLPQAFLIADELLRRAGRILKGLRIDRGASQKLLNEYGPFAATERALMELVRRGGDRQELHEIIREHSLDAWAALRADQPNPLAEALSNDPRLHSMASADTILGWLDAEGYVGAAPARAKTQAAELRSVASTQSARIS